MTGNTSPGHQRSWRSHRYLPHLAIWTMGLILLVTGWTVRLTQIEGEREQTLQAVARDLNNLTRISQEHTERVFRSADQTLHLVRTQYLDHGRAIDLPNLVKHGAIDTDIVVQVAVIAANGLLAHSSVPFSGRIDLSDREHFKAHLSNPGDELFISKPLLGRASGKWSIQLSRRIQHPDGRFAGVAVVSLDPRYFTSFFSGLELGTHGISSLYKLSGDLLARRLDQADVFQGSASGTLAFARIARGDVQGLVQAKGVSDGIDRLYYFRRLAHFPLVITIGLARQTVFADQQVYEERTRQQGLNASLLGVALMLLMSWYLFDRQRHLDAQEDALALLQNLTRRIPGSVYQFLRRSDGSTSLPYASEGMLRVYRIAPNDLKQAADKVFAVIHPDDLPKVVEAIAASARDLSTYALTYRVQFEDQEVRWLEAVATPQRSENGDTLWHGHVQDVTERKLQADALAAERANLQATLNAIPDLLFDVSEDTRILGFHSPRSELLVTSPENFLGRKMAEFLPEEAVEPIASAIRQAALLGHSSGAQYWLALPQGKRWFELSVARKPARDGLPDSFILLARDITDRKAAESELRVAAIAFESQDGMFVTDEHSVILRVNKAFTQITGYEEEDVLGKTPSVFASGRHDAAFYQAMRQDIAHQRAWKGEVWNRRKSGEIYPEWLTITAVLDENACVTHYVSTLTDITTRKAAEEKIKHLAFYDPLTNLPNRRLLIDRLSQVMAACARHQRNGAIIFLDLDNFKRVNDVHGHNMGDLILQQVAARLSTNVREGDTVARLGGDEFVIMLDELKEQASEAALQAKAAGEKILNALRPPFVLGQITYHSSASLGVTLISECVESVDELLKRADLALYEAKAAGKDQLCFFDPEMQRTVTSRDLLESRLRLALQRDEFLLYYQPQVNQHGRLTGVEALVRWQDPAQGLVSPASFIPLAEDTGLILPLGAWVLDTACAQLARWATDAGTAALTISVNVSARQFLSDDFVQQVLGSLVRHGAPATQLKLELTESLLVRDIDKVIGKMLILKSQQVGFSLDDFGTGYASLNYLRRLPLDQLKIDQSFLHEAIENGKSAAIVRTIVALSQALNLTVIAEGVETQVQRDFLFAEGCHHYQGYHFGRPGPVGELAGLKVAV